MSERTYSDPYALLDSIDTQMRYAAHDRERFYDLCVRREVLADAMEAIANSVARFFQRGGLAASSVSGGHTTETAQ